MAPPPATILENFIALLTTMIESFKDLSASLINYSAPPLKIMVAVLDAGQPLKRLNLSAPNYFSSNSPQVPKQAGVKPLTVV